MNRSVVVVSILAACSHPSAPPPSSGAPPPSNDVAPSIVASASAVAVPAPAKPPPPPYDLAQDLAERTAQVKKDLGAKAKTEVVEEVFLVVAPSGAMGSSAVVTKKALAAYFNGRFDRRPERAITVLLYETAPPYDAWCKAHWNKPCSTPFGFYEPELRTIVMNVGPGIGTLTHELVHPIVEADFPKAPDWINEGLASLYEAFALPKPGEIAGQKNFRLPRLRKALQSKSERAHASLPALFAMSDKEFRGTREDLNYATARYFCMWLEGQKKLWPFYRAWRDGVSSDPTGEKAFVAVMGKRPEELDGAWAAWVNAL